MYNFWQNLLKINWFKYLRPIGIFVVSALLTLIFILFLDQLAKNYIRKSVNLPSSIRRFGAEDNQQYIENYNRRMTEHRLFDFFVNTKLSNIKHATTSEIGELTELCKMKILQEQDRIYLAKAFNCLGIVNNNYREQDKIFNAIKNFSHSLEVMYLDETYQNLFSSIVNGFEDEVRNKKISLDKFTGLKQDEILLLNELIDLNIKEISARAYYRLSLINRLGRSSIKEPVNIDLKSAVDHLHKAREFSAIKQDNVVNIAITIDDKFSPNAAMVIASALVNADLNSFYNFYIVQDQNSKTSDSNKEKLKSMKWIADYNVNFIEVPENFMFSEVINNKVDIAFKKNYRYPKVITYRLYLDKFLPHLDKVLYLDSDLLVLDDLAYFNNIDLNDYFLAASLDSALPCIARDNCKSLFQEFYVNSGVILFNLKKMRQENAIEKMNMTVNNCINCDFAYADQDIINLTFENSIKHLSTRWNDLMLYRYVPSIVPEPISFIQHYAGKKPVKNASSINENIRLVEQKYFEYQKLTSFSNER